MSDEQALTYGPGSIKVERIGNGVLITVHQSGRKTSTAIHLPRCEDAVALEQDGAA